MSKLTAALKSAVGSVFPSLRLKSLRDAAGGGNFTVVRIGERDPTRLFRKADVRTLRNMAEHSIWLRAAIDIYRGQLGRAKWQIVPYDETRPVNERVKRDIEKLLKRPHPGEESYAEIKKKFIEDFLVVGHGAVEKIIRRDGAPYRLMTMDAASVAFVESWDGTDTHVPRYAQLHTAGPTGTEPLSGAVGTVKRYLADAHVMTMVNRPRSYDKLGLSHVEAVYRAVIALLEADDYLLRQITDAAPNGALDLGEGASQEQAEEMRRQIAAVRKAFVIIGGTKGARFLRFNGTEREMRLLDQQVWFVRQVAAIFQISTAKLRLAVDLSRANAGEMLDDDQEGPGALLDDVEEAENRQIVEAFGDVEEHNCRLRYASVSERQLKNRAELNKTQLGGRAWATTNEARKQMGLPALEMRIADEVLVPVGQRSVVPLSVLENEYFGKGAGGNEGDKSKNPDEGEESVTEDEEERRAA